MILNLSKREERKGKASDSPAEILKNWLHNMMDGPASSFAGSALVRADSFVSSAQSGTTLR